MVFGAFFLANSFHLGARMFGVPTATAETAVFGPGIGGRNSAAGLMLLVLSFNGLRSMAAIWIAMWVTFAGLTDTGICLRHGNNWETHMMNVGIGWIVATLLWNS